MCYATFLVVFFAPHEPWYEQCVLVLVSFSYARLWQENSERALLEKFKKDWQEAIRNHGVVSVARRRTCPSQTCTATFADDRWKVRGVSKGKTAPRSSSHQGFVEVKSCFYLRIGVFIIHCFLVDYSVSRA